MDANGIASILTAFILTVLGVYKGYPRIVAYLQGVSTTDLPTNGEKPRAKDKPTITNLNARIGDLETALQKAKEDYAQALEETGKQQERFQNQIDQQEKLLTAVQEQYQREIEEKAQITRQRNEAEDKYHKLLEKNNEDQRTIISMGNNLDTLEKRIDELEHQLAVNTSVEQAFTKFGDSLGDKLADKLSVALLQIMKPVAVTTEVNPT